MQMHSLSARIPADDFEWIAGLDIQGAVSPSDKVRALIAQMRRQHEGSLDYERSLAWLRDLLAPFVTAVRAFENQSRMHSEVLTLVAEWLPQVMATLLSERNLGKDARKRAIEIEDLVAQRCFQLLNALLRLGVTRDAGCYSPGALERQLPKALEISQIVAQTRHAMEDKS